jgi:putative ABC transport system permease protein
MSLLSRLAGLLKIHRLERDVEDELRAHIEMRAQDNLAAGMSPEEARYDAQRRFGNSTLVKEDTRAMDIVGWIETTGQNLRFALRMLAKNPGFTIVAALTLALGIGANSAIFSVVNAVLLQPLPYQDPGRLLFVSAVLRQTGATGATMSFTKFSQIKEQSHTLESATAFYFTTVSMVTEREPEAVNAGRVTREFFKVLGISSIRGRDFLPEEDALGAVGVAIISDGFWHSHFAAEPAALGRSITLDGQPVTIVGILPPSFRFPLQFPEPDVWIPRVSDPTVLRPVQVRSGAGYLGVIARLRSGEKLAAAKAELDTIDARYRSQFNGFVDSEKFGVSAAPLEESLVGSLRPGFAVLLAAVGFLLLIACANVANLLLTRATSREREMALRKALGASSGRLVRQLLTESLLLSLFGGMLGVALAAGILPTLRAFSPGSVPRLAEARLDASVLLFSILLSFVTGILFGFAPALQAAGGNLQETLKEGTRGSSDGGHRGKLRGLLVVAEMAVALVLMTGAGLLIQSFSRLMKVNPGFSSDHRMTFLLNLPPSRYGQPEIQTQFYRQLLERVKVLPGVDSAGLTSYLPLSGAFRSVYFCPEGTVCQGVGKDSLTVLWQVSAGYFDTVRTPILQGRVFTERDTASSPPVAIVNQTLADRYWPGKNPIGRHIANSRDMIQREVVGVVLDVKFNALNIADSEEMYFPLEQVPWLSTTLIVHSMGDQQALVLGVRTKIAEIDPSLPVTSVASMESIVAASVAQPRVLSQFVGVFAGFALLLAAIGIYGVMAYSVAARTQEMGIRMSLGAEHRDIVRLVVGQGMRLALLGVAIGIAASLALTRLISTLLFGVSARDPLAFSLSAVVLGATALVACYLPARRATRLDPIVVLRSE